MNERKSSANSKETEPWLSGTIIWGVIIYCVYSAYNASPIANSEGAQLFSGNIASISHRKEYRKRSYSRIVLDNYDYDFLLYHTPKRKQAILSLQKGQQVSFEASDEGIIKDVDGIKTFIISQITADDRRIFSTADEVEFKEEAISRFFE